MLLVYTYECMLLTKCLGDGASNSDGSPLKRTRTIMTVDVLAVNRTTGVDCSAYDFEIPSEDVELYQEEPSVDWIEVDEVSETFDEREVQPEKAKLTKHKIVGSLLKNAGKKRLSKSEGKIAYEMDRSWADSEDVFDMDGIVDNGEIPEPDPVEAPGLVHIVPMRSPSRSSSVGSKIKGALKKRRSKSYGSSSDFVDADCEVSSKVEDVKTTKRRSLGKLLSKVSLRRLSKSSGGSAGVGLNSADGDNYNIYTDIPYSFDDLDIFAEECTGPAMMFPLFSLPPFYKKLLITRVIFCRFREPRWNFTNCFTISLISLFVLPVSPCTFQGLDISCYLGKK
ncbi:uncharacterized protein LOC110984901 [Acanthaster planci]|uniref:Uncharacterized protein LOC110984901 n=1 Tax=Acanthaster planci TaxID=133434 RepID=A0A8B7ZDE7_ACAPL|nr:uncharacterized protein LOC110984901 [Acanthaster planci]